MPLCGGDSDEIYRCGDGGGGFGVVENCLPNQSCLLNARTKAMFGCPQKGRHLKIGLDSKSERLENWMENVTIIEEFLF